MEYSEDVQLECEAHFSKEFSFQSPKDKIWTLPSESDFFTSHCWEIEALQETKKELNSLKDQLSDFDIQAWHRHTAWTNRSGKIIQGVREEFRPELCTQAWCKFYEILSTYQIVPRQVTSTDQLNTIHLCEAPGAFITSLNHYLYTWDRDPTGWNWLATTLNPDSDQVEAASMIQDDTFMKLKPENWYFGEDNTGDVRNLENLHGLSKRTENLPGPIQLVTADGSVDCQDDPAEQESLVSLLHFCEAVTSLRVLSKGGALVLKVFTLFEASSICLIYLLNCVFQKVNVFKPGTSKAGNSEVYVVCLGYHGKKILIPYWDKLLAHFAQPSLKAMIPIDAIPSDFLEQLINCAQKFKDYQSKVIEFNLRTWPRMTPGEKRHLERVKICCWEHFKSLYRITKIPEKCKICPKNKMDKKIKAGVKRYRLEGSFNQRVNDKKQKLDG